MSKNTEDLSDDFVASLLSKEASENNIKYSALGLQAFLPKRSAANAPKPNTRFLRNIVREADNHNAALLAKEAEESRERLRQLHLKERAKRRGELDGVPIEKSRAAQRPDRQIYTVGAKRNLLSAGGSARNGLHRGKDGERRMHRSSREDKEDGRGKRRRSRSVDRRSRSPSLEKGKGRYRRESRSRERKGSGERKRDRSREHRSGDRREGHRHHSSRHHSSKDKENSRHSRRSRSHSRSHSRSRERGTDKSQPTSSSRRSDKKDRLSEANSKPHSSCLRSPRRRPDESDADHDRRRKRRKEMEMVEEAEHSSRVSPDPLDDIIGPAPPPATRIRGRGTLSGASAMDARFSENYDPSLDVEPDIADGDDWDDALEAYRDRQKWKALGAERLRAEGFGEDFIKAWENNDTKNTANIKWSKEGVREWDRGKVIEEGEVKVKAVWSKGP